MSEEFENLHIDILKPGRSCLIPPGWPHAVITLAKNAVLLNISITREDWIAAATDGLAKENQLLHSMSVDNLNTILDRRSRDLEMFTSLRLEEIGQGTRAEIDQFLKVQSGSIAEIETIKTAKQRKR